MFATRYRSYTIRMLLAATVALVLALALGACGSDDGDSAGGGGGGADSSAFPVTIQHKFGTTRIQEPPKRVVTVGFNEDDFTLALGVKAVGAREFIGGYDYQSRPWAQKALAGSKPKKTGSEELDFESVAALRPDLIMGVYSFMTKGDYAKFSKIAPTVAQTKKYPDGGVPWQGQTRATGVALGRKKQAEEVVKRVEATFATARKDHPEFKGKVLAVDLPSGGKHFILTPDDLRVRFFNDLGFETPKKTGELSSEQTKVLDQDLLVVIGDREKDAESDPLFKRLDVVKQGKVVYLPLKGDLAGALGYNSPLSLPFLIKGVVPKLAAASKGQGG